MKKALKVISIILIAAGVLSLLAAVLFRFAYYHTLDASSSHYARLRNRMTVCFVSGMALAAAGAACILIRRKQ